MSKQPKALRLVGAWEAAITARSHAAAGCAMAEELIRQHALIEEMREALARLIDTDVNPSDIRNARAVLAKVETQS